MPPLDNKSYPSATHIAVQKESENNKANKADINHNVGTQSSTDIGTPATLPVATVNPNDQNVKTDPVLKDITTSINNDVLSDKTQPNEDAMVPDATTVDKKGTLVDATKPNLTVPVAETPKPTIKTDSKPIR